jgi:hypothetical protein
MNTLFDLAYLAVFGLGALVLWRLCRDDRPAEEARAAEARARVGLPSPVKEWVYDGPDSLRLLEDTEQFINQLIDSDPELKAGCEQLWQAIRDEQEKGEQA